MALPPCSFVGFLESPSEMLTYQGMGVHVAHTMMTFRSNEALRSEMRDRFGEPPPDAERLFAETRLRRLAEEAGIRAISFPPEESGGGKSSQFLVIQAFDMDRAVAALSAASQEFRQIDETICHIRLDGGSRRRLSRVERTRISGEFLVSFLIQMFERGLSALTAMSENAGHAASGD